MKTFRLVLCTALLLGLTFSAAAEDEKEKKLKDEAEISFVDKTGNTDTTDLNLKNLMSYQFSKRFDGSWLVAAGYGKTEDVKTAENYKTELKGNYLLTDSFYASLLAGWEKDKFSGFDNRYYIGPALGKKIITGPRQTLLAELGARYVKEEYTNDTDDNFIEGRAYSAYTYKIGKTSDFKQTLEGLTDFNNGSKYKINSVTSITATINSKMYMKTSYEIKYNNEPSSDDIQKTDKILSVTLGINF